MRTVNECTVKELKDMTVGELKDLKIKTLKEKDKITTTIEKEPVNGNITSSKIIQTKEEINAQTENELPRHTCSNIPQFKLTQ